MRAATSGQGRWLGGLAAPPAAEQRQASKFVETYVGLPCDLFDPGKADPQLWMATARISRLRTSRVP